jgi:hypothetical protein
MRMKPEAIEPILAKMAGAGMIRKEPGKKAWKGKIPDVWVVV